MDDLDKTILSKIQTDFPIARRPFDALAEQSDATAEQIMARIDRMIGAGEIRRLGAVFDSKSLGYVSTLVAARIPPDRLDQIAEMVSELPGVTHNYRREHQYNLWFTLTVESLQRQREILDDLRTRSGIDAFFSMPALAVYKIRVAFQFGQDAPAPQPAPVAPSPQAAPAALTDDQKQLVRMLQESIPIEAEPFDRLAEQLGWSADRIIEQVAQWRGSGVIRRFGAVVDHRRLGFKANGMAVFQVPVDQIDDVGKLVATRPEVSHCYRRPPLEGFEYNFFAMVHGHSREEVCSVVQEIAQQMAPFQHTVLFSTTEYKKTSMKYFL